MSIFVKHYNLPSPFQDCVIINKKLFDQRTLDFNHFEYDASCAIMILKNDVKCKVRKWRDMSMEGWTEEEFKNKDLTRHKGIALFITWIPVAKAKFSILPHGHSPIAPEVDGLRHGVWL